MLIDQSYQVLVRGAKGLKLFCHSCLKPCKDEAVKFGDRYYHLQCFLCKECGLQLSTSDFYAKDDDIYCQADYTKLFGTKCKSCLKYIEGEVATALGFVFHKDCFTCSSCSKVLPTGSKVTYAANNFLCSDCFDEDNVNEVYEPVLEFEEGRSKAEETLEVDKEPAKHDISQVGFGKFYNVSYLEHLTSPMKKVSSINTSESSPRHYHRPENFSYTQVAKDFIKPPKKESSILLNDLDSEIALVGKTPRMTANGMIGIAPMSNREPVRLAKLPDAQLRAKAEDVADGKLVEKEQTESSCEKADQEKGQPSEESVGDVDGDDKDLGDDDDDGNEMEGAVGFDKDLDPLTGLRRLKSNPASTIYGTLGSMRTSLLNVLKKEDPVTIYPYEDLKFSNFRLPFGVERNSVERHLSRGEFIKLFRMTPKDFYSLAEWKRNDLKKRVDLF